MLIVGTDGPDTLTGTDSDDTIIGKGGDDHLSGLGGDDLFPLSFVYVPFESSTDIIDGGSGSDTFQVNTAEWFTQSSPITEPVRYSLAADGNGTTAIFEANQTFHITGAPHLFLTFDATLVFEELSSVENFSFMGTHDPAPSGTSTDDHLTIGELSSSGMTGQILFDGGSGNDVLDASAASNVVIALGGTGNDTLIGGSGNDTLYGQDGNDILTAGGGLNMLVGGTGDDTYYSDNTSNTIFEQPNEGYDTLHTTAARMALAPNVEKLQYTGTADFTGFGNDGDNWIQGDTGSDYLIGLGGNDILYGAGGLANTLQGGTGDDIYIVENPADTLVEFANEGHDTVLTTLTSYTLQTNFEDLHYSGAGNFSGTGNDADNFLLGGFGNDHLVGLGGNDTLDGGGGANILEGGTGDDLYIVRNPGDTVIEQANEGHDAVDTTLTSYTLSANVEGLYIRTGGAFTGNDLDNVFLVSGSASNVDGGVGNDTIIGGAGNDILTGGYGNDTLIGGLGGDELAGGAGADRFVFRNANDGSDLIHDFSRAEGDKIDVSELLHSLGPIGTDPFGNGVLTFQPIAAFGGSGGPATRVLFDPDGSAGPAAATSLFIALGSTSAVDHNDFIIM